MQNSNSYEGRLQSGLSLALDMREYQRGEEILHEGEESDVFQVILSGRVRISRSGRKLRVLGDQDVFGLESIVLKIPSYYTAIALDKCRIARYGTDALDHLIAKSPRMIQRLLASTLNQLAQTTHFLMEHSQSLDEATMKFYGDGEAIIDDSTSDTEFYRLVSTQGRLQVRMDGKEIAVIDKPGEFFGRLPGMNEVPANASVVSIGESVVEIYNIEDLDLLIRDHPEATRRVIRSMMSRFRK